MKSKTFEYIFNEYDTYASIFDYPKSTKEIGDDRWRRRPRVHERPLRLREEGGWNVGGPGQITEYEVPKTPIKTLSIPGSFPTSCAMDANGDLAVGIYDGTASVGGGDIVIFKNASGSGTVYTTPLDEEFFDGYDNQGNLFADGYIGYRSDFALVELPKGSGKILTIKTRNSVQFPGSVQWDGTYLTVFDQIANAILSVYRQRNEGEIERHCIALGRRLRADLDRCRRCPFAQMRIITTARFSTTRPAVRRLQR